MHQAEDLKALTSLRFVAAAMIVLHHAKLYFPWAKFVEGMPLNQGVSFFFVLSGFILTHVYSSKTVSFGDFMLRRFARLWPVHAVTIALVFVLIQRPDSRSFPGEGFFDPVVVFISNITLTHAAVPFVNYTFSFNSVSWSISTEVFFYLAFPFLLIGIKRSWPWKLIAAVAVIAAYALAARYFALPVEAGLGKLDISFLTHASPLFRGFEFVLGMSTYVLWDKYWRGKVGPSVATRLEILAAVVVVFWIVFGFDVVRRLLSFDITIGLWNSYASTCFVFALIIVVMANGNGVLARLISLRTFVWLGEISFALYMVHQIIMKALWLPTLDGSLPVFGPVVPLAACLIAATLLHHFVEKPAIGLVAALRPRHVTVAAHSLMRTR